MNDFLLEIEKYLDNDMSLEEKETFEAEVNSNPALAEELKLQQDMRLVYEDEQWIEGDKQILKNKEAKSLKSFFKSKEAAFLKTSIEEVVIENRSRNKSFYFIGVAASITILIIISLFVFKGNGNDKLYTQYIQIDDIPSLITRGEDNNGLIKKAQLLFENKKYNEAIEVFTQYQNETQSINSLSYIYTGIAYLELDEFDKAMYQFELLSRSNTLHAKKANWYMAMVYLKQNNKQQLQMILQSIISNKSSFKYKEAQELFEQIN